MSLFTECDFSESLRIADIEKDDIAKVLCAWGEDGCCAEWSGGFILRMKDGRIAVVTGCCDTTGWGCQDGADVTYLETDGTPVRVPEDVDIDVDPKDLNLYLASRDGTRESIV